MELNANILDDKRIKILNLLLQKQIIPERGEFNLNKLIEKISPEDYRKILEENPEFEELWKDVDIPKSLTEFLTYNGFAKKEGDNLELTKERGRDLKRHGNYNKLLEDERYITNEARRVSELELEANRMSHRQYKINLLIAFGTCVAATYYLLEILDGFFGFYKYSHHYSL